MKLKLLAILAVGLLLGAEDQAAKEVEKAITALNEAFQGRDTDKVKALMTKDHVAVTAYYEGPLDRAVRPPVVAIAGRCPEGAREGNRLVLLGE